MLLSFFPGEVRALGVEKNRVEQVLKGPTALIASHHIPSAYAFVEILIRQLLSRLDGGKSSTNQVTMQFTLLDNSEHITCF